MQKTYIGQSLRPARQTLRGSNLLWRQATVKVVAWVVCGREMDHRGTLRGAKAGGNSGVVCRSVALVVGLIATTQLS